MSLLSQCVKNICQVGRERKERAVTPARIAWITTVTAMVILWTSQIAFGCGYCTNLGNVLSVSHPNSIAIALATQKAIDNGKLENDIMAPPGVTESRHPSELARYSARSIVQQWASELTPMDMEPLRIHFLFVDTGETCELSLRGNIAIYSDGSTGSPDALIVTTQKTIHAIASGRMTLRDAVELNIALIESDKRIPVYDVFDAA